MKRLHFPFALAVALPLLAALMPGCGAPQPGHEPGEFDMEQWDVASRRDGSHSTLLARGRTGPAGLVDPRALRDLDAALPRDVELLILVRRPDGSSVETGVPGCGRLVTLTGDEPTSLPLEHTDVSIDVLGPLATGTVRQRFVNPYDHPIEASYVFPLPHDAAVHDFLLEVAGRTLRGVVREREEAQRIYAAARAQGYTAALLDQERPNVFTQSIANLTPKAPIEVSLTYLDPVDHVDGWQEIVFPMVVGPRYNPVGYDDGIGAIGAHAPPSGQPTDVRYRRAPARPGDDIDLRVTLDAGLAIEGLVSPTHDVEVSEAPRGATVRLASHARVPNRDFRLRWRVAGDGVRTSLVHDGSHALLTIHPPEVRGARTPLEHVFVVDTSGSMDGEPLALGRDALHAALAQLEPTDTFDLLAFDDRTRTHARRALPATAENLRDARRWIDGLRAGGGTELLPAVREALSRPRDPERDRVVTFLTDGFVGNEEPILAAVQTRAKGTRVFAVGLGTSPNRWILSEMARRSGGADAYVTAGENAAPIVDAHFDRFEYCAATGLEVNVRGARAECAVPLPSHVLYGRPVVLPFALTAPSGPLEIEVTGLVAGRRVVLGTPDAVEHHAPGTRSALGVAWARARLNELMARARVARPREAGAISETATALALEHGIVSAGTSFLCVDSWQPVTPGGDPAHVEVAVPIPAGVEYQRTVGGG